MILKLCMEKEDMNGMRITYYFKNFVTLDVVATATDNAKEWTTLYYENNKYEFRKEPKSIEKPQINIDYPLSSTREETLGSHIIENEDYVIAKSYYEVATCGKKLLLKKNIGFTVYEYQQEPYMLYHVGFRKEESHFYCLYNNYGETIAIIERHRLERDNSKARIYIEDDEHLLIALLVCTDKIANVGYTGNLGDTDPTAVHYISLLKEEKAMFDKYFMLRAIEKDIPALAEDLRNSDHWSSL